MNILFPQEGQTVALSSGQQVCIVSSPVSDAQGAQMRYSLNGNGWTGYGSVAPCFGSLSGSVALQMQFKNNANIEGSVITRNFIVQYQ